MINKQYSSSKNSIIMPIVIIIAILLVIGGLFSFFGDDIKSMNLGFGDKNQENQIKSSGLDPDKEVETVQEIEEVIAKWVEQNPEAILQSVANMQRKMAEEQNNNAKKSISSKLDEIYDDSAPAYEPKNYDVTIVEFFDYNCGYCKRANESVESLLSQDKNVRVIYRDFPILGKSSEDLAKVSIAFDVVATEKFREFHNKLMESGASTTEEALQVASKVGVSPSKVKKILSSREDRIMEIINENRKLGSSIGIRGTPAFIFGEELIPGAIGVDAMKSKIKELRKNK